MNVLTPDEPTDWGGGSGFYDAFVEVAPAAGRTPSSRLTPPFIPRLTAVRQVASSPSDVGQERMFMRKRMWQGLAVGAAILLAGTALYERQMAQQAELSRLERQKALERQAMDIAAHRRAQARR